MKSRKVLIVILQAGLVTFLASCGGNNPAASSEQQIISENNSGQNQAADSQDKSDDQAAAEEPAPQFQPLPVSQQQVEIVSEDGRLLEGLYYPAKIPNAPVVVLMHWAPGSMDDWHEIARWLQNRQDEIGMEQTAPIFLAGVNSASTADWTDQTWFPPMPEEISFAVLVFNFGGYGSSTGGRETWLLDAQAAVQYAASLPEVDPHQISALGASIGADGAVDGCYLLNDLVEMGTCVGAFSLSPGNYLTDDFSYAEAAAMLDKADHSVWCLAAEDDIESSSTCLSAAGERYRTFIFPSNFHGMRLIEQHLYPEVPPLEYDALQLVQEWLEEVYLLTLNQFSLE